MTVSSIGAAKGGGYARYLEGKTVAPVCGYCHLTPSGEPTQAPGRWLASPEDARAARGLARSHVSVRLTDIPASATVNVPRIASAFK